MSSLIAEVRACQGCGACLLTCPEHAIRPAAASHPAAAATHPAAASHPAAATADPAAAAHPAAAALLVHPDRCTGCGECVEVCPVDAIVLIETEPSR